MLSPELPSVSVLETIQSHAALCEEVYDFFLEENRMLRADRPVRDGILERKRFLLNALEGSLERMRATAKANGVVKSSALRSAAAKAQRILLKAMLLDKENEQLLLKHALSSSKADVQIIPKPTAKQVQKRYGTQN